MGGGALFFVVYAFGYGGALFPMSFLSSIEAIWSFFVLLMILVYFPAKPLKPPTLSASVERLDFKAGAKTLLR